MENVPRTIVTDNRFAIVPHWIIFSGISDGALRLYTVLTKYADGHTKQAFPSRTTLAKDMGKKSVRSIDGYMRELKEIGAVTVENRKRKGSKENQTNLYTVRTVNPNVVQDSAPPSAEDCSEIYTPLSIPNSSNATDSRIHVEKALPAPYGAGHSLHEQLGITEDQKNQLLDHLEIIYSQEDFDGMSSLWDSFSEAMEAWTDVWVEDALANKRWAESIPEKVEQAVLEGKSVRYGLGKWLGSLVAWCRMYA